MRDAGRGTRDAGRGPRRTPNFPLASSKLRARAVDIDRCQCKGGSGALEVCRGRVPRPTSHVPRPTPRVPRPSALCSFHFVPDLIELLEGGAADGEAALAGKLLDLTEAAREFHIC